MRDYEAMSKRHFNKQAPDYDAKNTVYYSKEGKISCKDVTKYLNNIEYENILDIGCGTGFLFELLPENKEKYGFDLSPEMLKMARKKEIPNTQYQEGSSSNLPYENETFDIVTCIQSFHHYPEQDKAMKEAYRVLKKGGLYILSDTGIGGIGAWIDNNIIFKIMKSGDYYTQNRNSIAKRMINAGFKIRDNNQIGKMIYTVVGEK